MRAFLSAFRLLSGLFRRGFRLGRARFPASAYGVASAFRGLCASGSRSRFTTLRRSHDIGRRRGRFRLCRSTYSVSAPMLIS
jgi:hypothetical protein